MKTIIPFFILIALLSSCKKDSDPAPTVEPDATYFAVLRTDHFVGSISGFNLNGTINSMQFDVPQPQTPYNFDWHMDAVVYDDKIYATRGVAPVVDIIDTGTLKTLSSVSFGNVETPAGGYSRHIEFGENKVFISDQSIDENFDDYSYLRVVDLGSNKIDSIFMGSSQINVLAMIQSKGKLFVSRRVKPYSQFVITVYDAASLDVLAELADGANGYSQMLTDKNGDVLAFGLKGMIKIDATSLVAGTEKTIFVALPDGEQNGGIANNRTVAIDKEANILYHLGYAPQPASAPFVLRKYDLNTDQGSYVTNDFINGHTIQFDPKKGYILVGLNDMVSFWDSNGTKVKEVQVGSLISEILIK